jgi:hypothetical protein
MSQRNRNDNCVVDFFISINLTDCYLLLHRISFDNDEVPTMKLDVKEEQGAVLVIVSSLVAAVVFLGILALVIDGGVVYLERRTVINAAETAALSVARFCGTNSSQCDPTRAFPSSLLNEMQKAREIANTNSPDNSTSITEICINGKTDSGGSCAPLSGAKLDCTKIETVVSMNFVRLRTYSASSEPSNPMKLFFSSGSGYALTACAQVRWGNASSASVYSPFAVSICEWAKQQGLPRVLTEFTTNNGVSDCTYSFLDQNGVRYTKSGIDGWAALDLQSSSLDASARASVPCPNPVSEKPAYLRIGDQLNQITRDQSSLNYCGDSNLLTKMPNWLNQNPYFPNQTLYLPLVSTQKISGNSTIHTVEAFAAFKLYGYSLRKGNGSASDVGGTTPIGDWCPRNTNCIYGEFIRTISSNSEISTGSGVPNVGIQAIELF